MGSQLRRLNLTAGAGLSHHVKPCAGGGPRLFPLMGTSVAAEGNVWDRLSMTVHVGNVCSDGETQLLIWRRGRFSPKVQPFGAVVKGRAQQKASRRTEKYPHGLSQPNQKVPHAEELVPVH